MRTIGGGADGAAWGSRAQLAGTVRELEDALGNRDGLWNDEAGPAGALGDAFDKNPLAQKLGRFLGAGLSTADEVEVLSTFVSAFEQEHGAVSSLQQGDLDGAALFHAQKAIALVRYGRSPADVTEGFVSAKGTVCGEPIADRELFVQRWRPTAEPTGKVIVLAPGFQETGRNFYEQIDKLNRQGHDVLVLDQQWGGHSSGGSPGGLDRGFGVARDVAAVMAEAQDIVQSDYGKVPGSEVVPVGNSMGAGAGVFSALVLMQDNEIKLSSGELPRVRHAALQAPFLRATDNLTNDALALASKLPFVNRLQVPSSGVPVLNTDDVGAQKGAQQAVLDDVRAQLRTMSAATEDLEHVLERFEERGLDLDLYVVHGDDDPLADPAMSRAIEARMAGRAVVDVIDSDNHVLEQNPGEQDHLVGGIARLLRD